MYDDPGDVAPGADPSFERNPDVPGGSGGGYIGDGGTPAENIFDFGQDLFSGFSDGGTPGGNPDAGPTPPSGGETAWYDNPYFRMGLRFLTKGNPLVAGLSTLFDMARTNGKSFAGQVGNTLGSALGGGVAGPLGALAGGMAGSAGMRGIAQPGTPGEGFTPPASSGAGQSPWGQVGQGLLGLYANNKMAKTNQRGIDQLQGLYAPGSPYAQQMKQSIERRDAAAGRRSQYGAREVELAAKLAELQSRNAPQINQMRQQQDLNKLRNLQMLFNLGGTAWQNGGRDWFNDLFNIGGNRGGIDFTDNMVTNGLQEYLEG